MVSKVRTIDFLPDIFKSKSNEQFFSASLDQLTQQPNYNRIQGYIGSKFGYGVSNTDTYIVEPSKARTNYQLEPAIIFTETDTDKAKDALTYVGLLEAAALQGSPTANNNSLFKNDFYSWDSFCDLDKLVNYPRYYWLPNGPDAVTLTSERYLLNATYGVLSGVNTYKFSQNEIKVDSENPVITLVRGSRYIFSVDQPSSFWIQTMPGLSGISPVVNSISTRDVFGVQDNGTTRGSVIFDVPESTAQDEYLYPDGITVDLATNLTFDDINGLTLQELGNIDGVVDIHNKTLLFYGQPANSLITYTIKLSSDANPIISFTDGVTIPNDKTILVNLGATLATRKFVRNQFGVISLLPLITAPNDTLYYQDGTHADKVGVIKLVDSTTQILDVNEILGSVTYESPNSIKLTNGLKVQFSGNIVPESYVNNQYYVEGVGTSIQLIPVTDYLVTEPFSIVLQTPFDDTLYDTNNYGELLYEVRDPDYLTIARNSIDKNAWSRSNRWFHEDVVKLSIEKNSQSPLSSTAFEKNTRAKRPIIEFYPNLKLFNQGSVGKYAVDYINFSVTDTFSQVNGQESFVADGSGTLFDGCRVIFANDADPQIKNKIYVASFIEPVTGGNPVISLAIAQDGDVKYLDQAQITKGQTYIGQTVWFNGTDWIVGQLKSTINQPPKFDVFDTNGISFGDTDFYNSSDFAGCTLFEYAPSSNTDDVVLGFPIKYSSVNNLGDISFDVTMNNQTFNYVDNYVSMVGNVNEGYVYNYTTRTDYTRMIGWQTAVEESFQYQVFNFVYDGISQAFTCDVAALTTAETKWKPIVVYVNNARQAESAYTVTINASSTVITLIDTPLITSETTIDVMVYSNQVSKIGFYQIPTNLDHNPFNTQLTSINFGDIKGHYKSICNNINTLVGDAFGSNNFRDLGNLVPYGTKVIQNSASPVAAGVFLRNKDASILSALEYNANEYVKFKNLLVDTINRLDFSPLQDNSFILDTALDQIASAKTESNPFFWSDMIPSKTPTISNTYSFNAGITTSEFPLSKIYDFDAANYSSVLIYLTRRIDGTLRTLQLVRGVDYYISTTEATAIVTKDLIQGDVLVVKQYHQTYGNFVPNTPSKLGLYPKFLPEVIYDNTYITPTYFIKGHDGSYTKLYGTYNDGYLSDFRDRALIEFETRIYNNIKVSSAIPLSYQDIFPGQFRTTDFSTDQLAQLYDAGFLNWIGLNRVDYKTQNYISTNEFTWNYKGGKSILGDTVTQGNWRGLFKWLYDTATPNLTPWEMLDLHVKPSWWESRYGEAPYTSDNTLLWEDLRDGFVYNDGNSYVNEKCKRPEILQILPVDYLGNIRSPFNGMLNNYTSSGFQKDWVVGDVGPTEYSYLKSSTWPFDLMRMFAVLKPAKFFALGFNLDTYHYNEEFNQYLLNDRFRDEFNMENNYFYGYSAETASSSYINWVVDYMLQYGVDGSTYLRDIFLNVDVRLSYRLAGFSDKDMLKFFVEKGSTDNLTTSLMIPDESYSVMLYENEPASMVVYSSIIVQKTKSGYKVYGNSQTRAYFNVSQPLKNGNLETITVNSATVYVYKNFTQEVSIVPYGTEFTTLMDLANFMVCYGNYLNSLGMEFTDIENGLELSWNQMVAETLYWAQSGWEVGSTVNVNPAANQIIIDKDNLIVQPLTLAKENYILNQNLVPIQIKDLSVYRKETLFTAKALNAGDSISYLNAKLSNVEHIIIFDNRTSFNDLIFNPVTALRQQRLMVKGTKTAEWNGTMNAAGFIINENNVQQWKVNQKYTKGIIVKYKNKYWMSQEIIAPSETFDTNKWMLTDYDKIRTGLLPNASNRAYESTIYYDTNRANLENDGDLLGFSLIGFRPRDYMVSADLDDVTQVNVFKNMLGVKGTNIAASGLNNLKVQQNVIDYDLYENWAIKSSEYGGTMNQNFVEYTLSQSDLVGNPSISSLIVDTSVEGSQQQVPLYKLKNYGRQITNPNILPVLSEFEEKLPNAGYVNMDDVRALGYSINSINDAIINDIYRGDYIWVADNENTWNVYSLISMESTLTFVLNNLNGTATFTFSKPHNLTKYDSIGVLNFSSEIDGFYTVEEVNDLYSVIVPTTLSTSSTTLSGSGLPLKMQYQRVGTARDADLLPILNSEFQTLKVWVDKNTQGNWTVYEKKNRYTNSSFVKTVDGDEYGVSTAYIDGFGYFVTDPVAQKLYQYQKANNRFSLFKQYEPIGTSTTRFGTAIVHNDKFLIVSDSNPDAFGVDGTSHFFVYKITNTPLFQTLTLEQVEEFTDSRFGDAMALSGDGNYLYSNLLDYGIVAPYQLDTDFTYTDIGLTLSAATVVDSTSFIVSGNKVSYIEEGKYICFDNAGNETVYTVITGEYDADTNKTTFYVLEPIEYTFSAGTTVYTASYHFSLIMVYVNAGDPTVPDLLTQPNGAEYQFGYSLATNNDGTKLFIGEPKWNYDNNNQSVGKAWVYDRIVTNVEAQRNGVWGSTFLIVLQYLIDPGARISLNGRALLAGEYLIAVNRVGILGELIKAGDIITVSTGRFVVMEQLVAYDSLSEITPGEEFGFSLDCTTDASELIIGSPYSLQAPQNQGAVYRQTNGDKRFGMKIGTVAANFTEPTYFYINGYVVNAFRDADFLSTVTLNSTSVTLSLADAALLPSYGVLSFNKTDTGNVRSIAYNNVNKTTGVVTFSVAFPYNITFESPTSYVSMPLGDSVNIANAINGSNITNVFAYSTSDLRLVIRLRDINLSPVNNKLNITVLNGTDLFEMGFQTTYTRTQVLTNPHPEQRSMFGYAVKYNEFNSFLVSAPSGSRYSSTTFDFSNDSNYHNDTVFDNGFTVWVDVITNAGAVYMYDYINTFDESLTTSTIGKYLLAQSINDTVSVSGLTNMYGKSLSFDGYVVMVGDPNYVSESDVGRVTVYENSENTPDWSMLREYVDVVDVSKIQKIELYDNITNVNLTSLDYFDPLNGKLLGVVRENLDFISTTDPAGYNNPSITTGNASWGREHVGMMWFDTSTVRFINYHQNDVVYDSRYWGAVFPGSSVSVYTWVESEVNPSEYTGSGIVYDFERYSVAFGIDANSIVVPKYYFWVRNTNVLNSQKGKTLTDAIISSYILNPQGSGISYFSPLRANTFAIYNAAEYIRGNNTNIHIGFSSSTNDSSGHAEFKLIRSNYPTDFLPGVPSILQDRITPESLYDRMLDSLAGTDETGAVVPDPYLPKLLQTGINARPRQSFFVNRFKALENYFSFVNDVVALYPVAEFGNASYLAANGEFFNVMSYWDFTYWWATGYNSTTRTSIEVALYADLETIVPTEGLTVGVAKNGQGKREVYVYTNSVWERVGLQDGTIVFSNKLWDYVANQTGYGDNYFDSVSYDEYPSIETRFIIRAINEQIFVDELLQYKNQGLILLFNYIQSENIENNNYMPWLTKTSLADVKYHVRDLAQYDKYRDDNQELLEGYINEIKPYHVVIKEFTLAYTGQEVYNAGYTDFDLPAFYNSDLLRFVSPQLVFSGGDSQTTYDPTSQIWKETNYTSWYNNYGVGLYETNGVPSCSVAQYASTADTFMYVSNARGLPIQGTFTLEGETIGYSNIDRDTGLLQGLSRGLYGTTPTAHYVGEVLYVDIPGVIVLNPGRRYTSAPQVSVVIDTSIYPAPKVPATVKAVLGNNRIVAIEVVNPGSGYVVTPNIIIEPSYSLDFTGSDLDWVSNGISIAGLEFITGDLVRIESSTAQVGAVPVGYYYVRVLTTDLVGLYSSKLAALDDSHRISLNAGYRYTDTNDYSIGIVATAISNLAGNKVRTMTETIKFDRTSYQSKVVDWEPDTFWSSPYISIGNDASSDQLLYNSEPYTIEVDSSWVSPSGGTGAILNVYNVLLGKNYAADVDVGGEDFNVGDVITIPYTELDGQSSANDCIITVVTVGAGGDILTFNVAGVAVDVDGTASLQGAVMPITSINNVSGNAYVTVSLTASGLDLGQIKGGLTYLYNTPAAYTYDDSGDSFTASVTGTVLDVSAVEAGTVLAVGTSVHCPGIASGTVISSFGTGSGGIGTYNLSHTTAIFEGSIDGYTLTVTALTAGTLKLNQTISGSGIASSTLILSFAGLNGLGQSTYTVSISQTVASTTITSTIPSRTMNTVGGAVFEVHKPRFSIQSISNQYTLRIIDAGSIYNDNDFIIIPGALLGGITGTNDATVVIEYVTDNNEIYISTVVGVCASQYQSYYVNPISQVGNVGVFQLYSNATLMSPVSYSSSINYDYAYVPEPLISSLAYKFETSSLVRYENAIWRCVESNNDSTFDTTKWEVVRDDDRQLNALDRISVYYNPITGMIGNNLSQLLTGIVYPNNVYRGNMYATEDQFPVDIVLGDLPYAIVGLTIADMLYDGVNYVGVADGIDGSYVLISDDFGENWNFVKLADIPLGVTSISFTTDHYVITTTNIATSVMLSYDKINWVSIGEYTPYDSTRYDLSTYDTGAIEAPNKAMYGSVFTNGKSYVVGDNAVAASFNYSLWEQVYSSTSRMINILYDVQTINITHFVGFIAVGRGDVIVAGEGTAAPDIRSFARIITSLDGTVWTTQTPTLTSAILYGVGSNTSTLVVVGENAEIWYSRNSANWHSATISGSAITDTLRSVAYGNGRFVVVGDAGTILVSTDGITFTQTTSSGMTDNLLNVFFDSGSSRFVAVGENDTIIRSSLGVTWTGVSYTEEKPHEYDIVGSEYSYGYGPEELVAGVVTDTLQMNVTTAHGSYWDNDIFDGSTVQDFWYYNTGFNIAARKLTPDLTNTVSFSGVMRNPTTLSVYILDETTYTSVRIYEISTASNATSYEIDWINQTITLNQALSENKVLLVEVYDIGNGRQLFSGNSNDFPLQEDSDTGQGMFLIDIRYQPLVNDPVMYVDGIKLEYETDYTIVEDSVSPYYSRFKILFADAYGTLVNKYIVGSILGSTITDTNTATQYGYSIPDTLVIVGTGTDTYDISSLNLSGDNVDNLVVELNGGRLVPPPYSGADYSITNGDIILVGGALSSSDILSITAYNETGRLWLVTDLQEDIVVSEVTSVYNTLPAKITVSYINDLQKYDSGDLIRIDGAYGSIGLNGNTYYVKDITEPASTLYTYELYQDENLTQPVDGFYLGIYNGGACCWLDSQTIVINSPAVPNTMPDIGYHDGKRTWTSLNGLRIDPDRIFFREDNKLSICVPMSPARSDYIMTTVFVDGDTPESESFLMSVSKTGAQEVYRTNVTDGTWLTSDLIDVSTEIQVKDVTRIVKQFVETSSAKEGSGLVYVPIQSSRGTSMITAYSAINVSTGETITTATLQLVDGKASLVFDSGVTVGQSVQVTYYMGNTLQIGAERIYFGAIDVETNTISNLIRGVNGSAASNHSTYSMLYGINEFVKLDPSYYGVMWETIESDSTWDPLQLSTTPAATFLRG